MPATRGFAPAFVGEHLLGGGVLLAEEGRHHEERGRQHGRDQEQQKERGVGGQHGRGVAPYEAESLIAQVPESHALLLTLLPPNGQSRSTKKSRRAANRM